MNVRLIKLTKEYYTQLSEMIDEWKLDHEVNQGNRSPWAIFKNDYHDFDYYLEHLAQDARQHRHMTSRAKQSAAIRRYLK